MRTPSELLQKLPALLGPDVRVIAAPCVGRCEQAPVAVINQAPVVHADVAQVLAAVEHGNTAHPLAADDGNFDFAKAGPAPVTRSPREVTPAYTGLRAYRAAGGYQLATRVARGELSADEIIQAGRADARPPQDRHRCQGAAVAAGLSR